MVTPSPSTDSGAQTAQCRELKTAVALDLFHHRTQCILCVLSMLWVYHRFHPTMCQSISLWGRVHFKTADGRNGFYIFNCHIGKTSRAGRFNNPPKIEPLREYLCQSS